jgi:hypothetical protein
MGWNTQFKKSPIGKFSKIKDSAKFDFSDEPRNHVDDEGIEYEYVYSDGTKELKKC